MNKFERTKLIIDGLRGTSNEFSKLQGILCVDHGWNTADSALFHRLVDTLAIAARMDELNALARAGQPSDHATH